MERKEILSILAALVLLMLVMGLSAVVLLLRSGRPQREGRVSMPGLEAAVEVRWDAFGVPHLLASSGPDLAQALGYLHASDRMTQLELGRRAAAGRLAEILGPPLVETDREMRTLRLRPTAESLWRQTGEESRRWLVAYSRGVNAWLQRRGADLPPGLRALGIRPEPWSPVDSLSQSLLMARNLSFWQGRPEELRLHWLGRLGPERAAELVGPPKLRVPPEIAALAGGSAVDAAPRPSNAPGAPGSNNWALGPGRSAEGGPVVANDPHLPLRLPPVWYQAHLRAPDYQAAGMTLPGLPSVVIGQSEDLAWALTNLMLDDHDVFFEELDADGARVRRGEDWEPLAVERQTIRVRGADPTEIVLLRTGRGPLLPADPATGLPPRSLAWTAYEPSDPLAAFLHLARAARVEEVPGGIGSYVCPAQNLVVADRHGGLLHTVLGRIPRRTRGDGRLPAPGWDPAYGWAGLLPADDSPAVLRPPDDLLVTANSDPRAAGFPRALGGDFDLASRADRIRQVLDGRDRWGAADLAAVQTDVVSLYAGELAAAAAELAVTAPEPARQALAAWDGTMAVEGPAALFALFERRLVEAVFDDELELDRVHDLTLRHWLQRLVRGEMSAAWFDDLRTEAIEDRGAIFGRALEAAWSEGVARWGERVDGWSYGAMHPLKLSHPLRALPLLGVWFDRGPFPMPGSATTVAAFGGPWRGAGALPVAYGPSMRWIAVPGHGDRALAVLPGGQSGHPWDPHYDDQLPLYLEGRLLPQSWSEEAIERAAVARLRLEPAPRSQ